MKHEEESLLSALLDGELEGVERVQLHKHLNICLDCQAQLESLRKVKTILAQAPKKSLPADWNLPASNHPSTLNPFRKIKALRLPSLGFLIPAGIAVAASLAIGLWILQSRWMFPSWQSSRSFLSFNSSPAITDMSSASPMTIVAPPIANNPAQPQTETP